MATDGLKIMADYSAKTGKFTERSEYKMLGTAEQRIRKSLNKCVEGYCWNHNYDKKFFNPLGLDKTEVQKYCETGDDSNCKTFKIMKNADGEPAFIVNTSTKYGFNEKSLGYIQQSIDRLNAIDPTIIDTLTNRYGLTCLSYDMADGDLAERFKVAPNSFGSYSTFIFGNVVVINQNLEGIVKSTNPDYPRLEFTFGLLVEARAVYFREMSEFGLNIEDAKEDFYHKPGIDIEEADKFYWLAGKVKEWLGQRFLTKSEYDQWMITAESMLCAYDPSYTRTWTQLGEENFIPEK